MKMAFVFLGLVLLSAAFIGPELRYVVMPDKTTYKVTLYSGGKEVRRFTTLGKPYVSRGVIRFKGSLECGEVIVMGTETVVVEKF